MVTASGPRSGYDVNGLTQCCILLNIGFDMFNSLKGFSELSSGNTNNNLIVHVLILSWQNQNFSLNIYMYIGIGGALSLCSAWLDLNFSNA